MPEFNRAYTQFALLAEPKWIICILPEQKPTIHSQKEAMILTGTELVKVHTIENYKMIDIVQEVKSTLTGVDEKVITRPGSYKGVKTQKLNKPIPVEFTPNIRVKYTEEVKTLVGLGKQGEIYDIPEGLTSAEKATLVKLMGAQLVVARFEMKYELLPKASPYRSQAKI